MLCWLKKKKLQTKETLVNDVSYFNTEYFISTDASKTVGDFLCNHTVSILFLENKFCRRTMCFFLYQFTKGTHFFLYTTPKATKSVRRPLISSLWRCHRLQSTLRPLRRSPIACGSHLLSFKKGHSSFSLRRTSQSRTATRSARRYTRIATARSTTTI